MRVVFIVMFGARHRSCLGPDATLFVLQRGQESSAVSSKALDEAQIWTPRVKTANEVPCGMVFKNAMTCSRMEL